MTTAGFTELGHVDSNVPGAGIFLHECNDCGAVVRGDNGISRHLRWHHKMHELVEYPLQHITSPIPIIAKDTT